MKPPFPSLSLAPTLRQHFFALSKSRFELPFCGVLGRAGEIAPRPERGGGRKGPAVQSPPRKKGEGLLLSPPWRVGVGSTSSDRHAPGGSRKRKMRSKVRWLAGFCNSHYVSHFAASFIDVGAKTSIAESGNLYKFCIKFVFAPSGEGREGLAGAVRRALE